MFLKDELFLQDLSNLPKRAKKGKKRKKTYLKTTEDVVVALFKHGKFIRKCGKFAANWFSFVVMIKLAILKFSEKVSHKF